MKDIQRVVIVGGGFGGVKAALELANKAGFAVTLISNSMHFSYHAALYRTATGRSPLEVVIPLHKIFERAENVEIVLDDIVGLNPRRKTVRSETGNEYRYDSLIFSLGNDVNYFGIEGMDKHSFAMANIQQTIALRSQLVKLFRQPAASPTIVIVGAGPTGTELAGELRQFARRIARRYGTRVSHPKVILIEGGDRVLPMFDPVLSAKAYKRLQKLGVQLRLNTRVNSCQPGSVCLDGEDITADAIIWTAGSTPVSFFALQSKVFQLERGKVIVDDYLRAKGQDDIYVIGDNASTPYSGMGQTAVHDASFVSRNLVRQRKGMRTVAYRTRHPIYVVPIGEKWAVYQSDKQQLSGYRAWLARRQADRWMFKHFLPYKQAIKQWRQANRSAQI